MNGDGNNQKQLNLDPVSHYLVLQRDEITKQLAVIRSPVMTTLDALGMLVNALVGITQALYAESANKHIIELPPGVKIVDKP